MKGSLKVFVSTIAFALTGVFIGREIVILDIARRGSVYPTGDPFVDMGVTLGEIFCGAVGGILGLIIGIIFVVKKSKQM
jgi:hypothetical protein